MTRPSNYTAERQRGLWESECPSCRLYDDCGGASTAPCTCIWSGEKRHRCETCNVVCRQRYSAASSGVDDTFSAHVVSGLSLNDLQIEQRLEVDFPLLIPVQTNNLPSHVTIHSDWIGIDLRYVVTQHEKAPIYPRTHLTSAESAREFARGQEGCNLLAILNGTDRLLESFWNSDRVAICKALKVGGFMAATGPTFSVYKRTNPEDELESRLIPETHSVTMLRRHHRAVQEIAETGIASIPNLYWRDERDRACWSDWLKANPSVKTVSRDLSGTKRGVEYRRQLRHLADLISTVERPLHVLLQGIGRAKGADALAKLAAAGATCSLCTSDPVLKALKGKAFSYREEAPPVIEDRNSATTPTLALNNIEVMQQHLKAVASTLSVYS